MQLEEGSEFIKIPPKYINDSISAIEKHVLHFGLKVLTVFEISKRQSVHTIGLFHINLPMHCLDLAKKAFFDNENIF